jgi:hypothetical protein
LKTEPVLITQLPSDLRTAKEAQAQAEEKQAAECFSRTVDTT